MKKQGSPDKTIRSVGAATVIGRERFARISAVEGIRLTGSMKARADEFDRQGIPAEERRRSIIRIHRKA